MPALKPYEGTKDERLMRIQRWVWILIYGGLLAISLSQFLPTSESTMALYLLAGGLVATVLGVLLIYIRSKLPDRSVGDTK